jgi:hypothetical protein
MYGGSGQGGWNNGCIDVGTREIRIGTGGKLTNIQPIRDSTLVTKLGKVCPTPGTILGTTPEFRSMAQPSEGPSSKQSRGVETVLGNNLHTPLSEPPSVLPVQHLFVYFSNPSHPSQKDAQKAISAHVQHVSFRKRQLAAVQRLRTAHPPPWTRRICHCRSIDGGHNEQQRPRPLHLQTVSTRAPGHFSGVCPTCNGQLNRASRELAVAAKPRTLLGAGSTDPFATMSTPMTHAMYGHLHHCKLSRTLQLSALLRGLFLTGLQSHGRPWTAHFPYQKPKAGELS